ncbi:MAG: Txe/YoeB family addiction module toxin [Bacteroidota bacterium]
MSEYRILILKKAEDDLVWFRKNDRRSYLKCFDLLRSITTSPREGIGKPERLKYFEEQEVYSRRVNQKDRIVYVIYEKVKEIDITSCKGHYD